MEIIEIVDESGSLLEEASIDDASQKVVQSGHFTQTGLLSSLERHIL